MRYLVTGAQGFAGRFVCAQVLRRQPDATIVGTGRSGELHATFTHRITWQGRQLAAPLTAELMALDRRRYRYIPCDLGDAGALRRLVHTSAPDVVIHLAAALRDDAAAVLISSNVGGTTSLIQALATLTRTPRLILGSSGSVYGAPDSLPLSEEQRCSPHEPYAMSKFAAELVSRVLTEHAQIPTVVARIFNIAGPGQDERHVCGRFAAQAAAIRRGEAPPSITIGDLRPTRDFIDVRDVAQAIVCLAVRGVPGETYNIASGQEIAIHDILAFTLRAAGIEGVTLVERYSRPADVPRAYADIRKLQECGFRAEFSIARTIADLVAYYLENVSQAVGAGATTSATS